VPLDQRIPERFRVDVVRRIGHGGEATVYELTGGRALRVYHGRPHDANEIAAFYGAIAAAKTTFALPQILEQGEDAGVFYSVDRLIPGRPLHELMPKLTGEERAQALASYTDAAFEIASLPLVRDEYGEFLRDADSIRAATWHEYLLARMNRSLHESPWLQDDVPALGAIAAELTERIAGMTPVPKTLVHGDYFPGNVLISDDLTVSGVIDFGPLTVIGDPWLDLASAVIFLEVARPGYTPADTKFVTDRLVARVGAGILDAITTYRGWYAIRFAPYRDDDPNLYKWCTESLSEVGRELGV
jgi:aminoglycoside phosphotransferase (APT) family kinase protein